MLDLELTNKKFGGLRLNTYKPKVVVRCDICNKESTYTIRIKSKVIDNNIKWLCYKCAASKKEVKNKLSIATKRSWQNEEYRQTITNSTNESWNNEEYRKKHSISINSDIIKKKNSDNTKKSWRNSEYRKLRIEQIKEMWRDPNFKNMMSIKIKSLFKNEEFRDKWLKAVRSDEFKKKMFDHATKLFNDNIFKEKWLKIIRSKEHRKIISNNLIRLWKNKEYRNKLAIARENNPSCGTKIELILYSILDDLKINYYKQYRVGFYLFDCFLPDYNVLIECNGDYWHSLPKGVRNDKSKSTYINEYFPNYKLYSIWEHEFKCLDKVKDLICYWIRYNINNIDFEFKDVIIKYGLDTNTSKIFLSKYHYLNTIGNHSIRIGAYLNDELIALCIYGPLTRKESADKQGYDPKEMLELTRFCIHSSYHKKNFASWFISKTINYIKKLNKYKCLISFADSTFNHTGCIYKASNWILDGVLNPDYWYVDSEGYVMHKKTLYKHAISLKLKEAEFSANKGYTKVYGKEKYRYILKI